ncbi:hypothetical protein [Bradyrhizobium sp. SZCCHNS1012]|uniref:hypothetical protein n=1 Tax=Bradyrhizobium sp. SZCCHNS1012 TaxID=3057297 RepID=UPI002916CAA3|nr:hypothetical protein [Bradyrhizobium sp. SZCCHNS1012]
MERPTLAKPDDQTAAGQALVVDGFYLFGSFEPAQQSGRIGLMVVRLADVLAHGAAR